MQQVSVFQRYPPLFRRRLKNLHPLSTTLGGISLAGPFLLATNQVHRPRKVVPSRSIKRQSQQHCREDGDDWFCTIIYLDFSLFPKVFLR